MTIDPEDDFWDRVRVLFDEVGMAAIDNAVANGVPQAVAGERIAWFNDMLIVKLKERLAREEQP